ncbi:hypothetical protein [Clostridium formicaceticum]|uniref:hypothetical protein n=1 Tax=Clostridium formicaceticum TaxID=1497 RepID=UPI0012EC82E8|nr:hypothetical protein [Clostridium formicaceticum]
MLDILGLNTLYQERQIKQLSQECDIIWLGSPVYYALFRNTKDKVIVYDKMDDYAYLTRNPLLRRLIRKNEKQLIDRASLIFTTCHVFFEQLKEKNNSVFLIKNGVDSFNFKTNISNRKNSITSHIEELKNQGKTVFGYIGTIDHWFDFNAIEQIIRHNDKFDVVLIGKNNMPKLDQSNIYYFDPVKKEELACIVNRFDFCLYPFKKDDFLDTINPVKLYEYLSQNKKVIAVSSNETREFENHIKLYSDYRELNNILSDLENIPNPFADNLQAGIFTSENSWSVKAEKISRQLVDVFNSKLSNEK